MQKALSYIIKLNLRKNVSQHRNGNEKKIYKIAAKDCFVIIFG